MNNSKICKVVVHELKKKFVCFRDWLRVWFSDDNGIHGWIQYITEEEDVLDTLWYTLHLYQSQVMYAPTGGYLLGGILGELRDLDIYAHIYTWVGTSVHWWIQYTAEEEDVLDTLWYTLHLYQSQVMNWNFQLDTRIENNPWQCIICTKNPIKFE